MSNESGRRRFLVAATCALGSVGVIGAAVPLVGAWAPRTREGGGEGAVRVDVSKLEPGQQMVAEWRGQPVFVLKRTEFILESLVKLTGTLADPASSSSVQPKYVDARSRSIRPAILVVIGLCTHLGCSPTFRPEVAPQDLGPDWLGGYFCPCHGSRYDLAGRVYKAQPAPLNLPVPPYMFESDNVLVLGVDQEPG